MRHFAACARGMRTDCQRGKACTCACACANGFTPSGNKGSVYHDLQLIVCSVEVGGLFEKFEVLTVWVPPHWSTASVHARCQDQDRVDNHVGRESNPSTG
jgi:hypothetical protein